MHAERVTFRLNAAVSFLPPLLFFVFTVAWTAGLVLYWADLSWIVRALSILFVAWTLSWWQRFASSARRRRAGEEVLFINLPREVRLLDGRMEIEGFLLKITVLPEQVMDVGGELPGLHRIVVRFDGRRRVLSVLGGGAGMERIVEWCFYNGVELVRRGDQRM
jgi:hypothetical protein